MITCLCISGVAFYGQYEVDPIPVTQFEVIRIRTEDDDEWLAFMRGGNLISIIIPRNHDHFTLL